MLTGTTSDPQARLAYELAMANRDAEGIDEAIARDFDDRLSDDSSGGPLLPHVSDSSMLWCMLHGCIHLLFESLKLTFTVDFENIRSSMQGCCWRLCGMHS